MTEKQPTPVWFSLVSVTALVWNFLGVMAFFGEIRMSANDIAALPEPEAALYAQLPLWSTYSFAIAVFAGLLGSILFFMRRKWSVALFLVSLLGIIVQDYHAYFVIDSYGVYGAAGLTMPVLVAIVAILLLWLSVHYSKTGWFR